VSHEKGDPANLNPSAGTAEGITEVQRQEALLKTGALQKAILNSANFSSIATDEKGVIQIFNVGAERMLGYARPPTSWTRSLRRTSPTRRN